MFAGLRRVDRFRHTERALGFLVGLTLVAFVMLIVSSLMIGASLSFLGVALTTAFATYAVGLALGLFFGLPSLVAKVADGSSSSPDSTSLEQIADWLVKIVVGVTLTRFDHFSGMLENAAAQVSAAMACRPSGAPCPAPVAGTIMACFSIMGFLTAYLWMRRYFIGELRRGRDEAERRLLDQAAKTGDLQEAPSRRAALPRPNEEMLAAIVEGEHEDDPWKGQFGGHAESDVAILRGEVEPLETRPDLFAVTIVLEAKPGAERSLNNTLVVFFIHPSFGRERRTVVMRRGRAELDLVAYGAFTVGAATADGKLYELDLVDIPGAPSGFVAN